MVVATQSQTDQVKQTPFEKKEASFDKSVLEPLRAVQAEEARKYAEAEAERLRQAQIALQADLNATANRLQPQGTFGNNYTALNCTWYVASRIQVPNGMGNAREWQWGLTAAGFRTGEPRRGAIGVTQQGWAGHVVVAEQIVGDKILISEYNYIPYSYSQRWVGANELTWFFQ